MYIVHVYLHETFQILLLLNLKYSNNVVYQLKYNNKQSL